MKIKIVLFLLCLVSLNVMGQGTIQRKKKQPTETVTPKPKPAPKPTPKQTVKKCDICEKPLSKCDYGGEHPKCSICGKLKERCEYKGEHPKCKNCGKYESECEYNGNHPLCNSCGKTMERCEYGGKHGVLSNHEWVDLGLSVKWATCNVGASSPSDYGGYYAWGETSTKSRYDWSNCFDCLDSTGDSWRTYKLGGQTRITPTSGHDTARENWGDTWRMPTDAENDELCKKCTWTWTTQGGHNGYRVTGPNGNSIFLPAAGWRGGTDTGDVGENGLYLSSTLCWSHSFRARYLDFNSSGHKTNGSNRRIGRSVRPVIE